MDIFTLEFWRGLWDDLTGFLLDLPLVILDSILGAIATLIEALPVPSFLNHSIGDVLAPTMPYIGYFMVESGIAQALSILAAGLAFRLTRKLITLGQW